MLENPSGYLHRSFDFGRQFLYKWTVNWKFVPEDIFLSKEWALLLLCLHAGFLLLFLVKWSRPEGGVLNIIWPLWKPTKKDKKEVLRPERKYTPSLPHFIVFNRATFYSYLDIVMLLFTGNFIGIVFARSLHYQFYVWYFHSLPFLLWHTHYHSVLRYLPPTQ